jgi:DNA-binding SARP family transcriptional activator
MLRLIAFGGLTLLQGDRPLVGAAAGRRRLALLALLTTSGTRGMNRDAIAEVLWPDSEPELARHSLHQLIFAMRRSYGCDELLVGAPMLHLGTGRITSDVADFDTAIRRREFEAAVALYRGPFAEGFSLPGATEAQRRLEASRVGYAREYFDALETLARNAAGRDDLRSSARWWRLRADADPLSGHVARQLIEALVATDDRAQALQFALVHESLVRQELESPPDPEIAQWIQRLRATRDSTPRTNGSASGGHRSISGPSALGTDYGDDAQQRWLARLRRAVGGKYRVESLIDESSIAASFVGTTTTGTGQPVEVHVIQPRLSALANGRRFGEVLGKVARLAHPHINPPLDIGVVEDVLYYVTAPRAQLSLRARLSRSRELPIREAVDMARGIAEGLGEAHEHGVWHGDLRPKHVGLTSRGPVLSALGVIEAITSGRSASDGSTIVTFGSPSYLSPEQLTGGTLPDARSDVYAAGCIAYEMLAGEPPFGRSIRSPNLGAKLREAPALLRTRRESVPEELELIVHTCLARVPADRYPSGEELARALMGLQPSTRH